MDLFTHMLVAYFFNLALGNQNEYVMLFSVIMGIAPDIDILWSPFIGHKHPGARHHGFTHSILFVTIAAFVGTLILNITLGELPMSFAMVYAWGLLGGFTHLLGDFLTTWSCPLLYPIKRDYRFSIDTAVNPYLTLTSAVLVPGLFSMRVYGLDYATYLIIAYSVFGIYLAYFATRLSIKLALRKRFLGEGRTNVTSLPTANPFIWYIVERIGSSNKHDKPYRMRYMEYRVGKLGGKWRGKWKEFSLDECRAVVDPPIDTIEKAIAYTFNTNEVQDSLRKLRYPVVKVISPSGAVDYPYSVFWYALEMEGRRHIWGIMVDVNKDGTYTVKRKMYRKSDLD